MVLKKCADVFPPSLAHLANLSFAASVFSSSFKLGHVVPLLKKPGSDEHDPSNYRPIMNLVKISKILERLVLARLQPHIHSSRNFSPFQSAYRRSYSTETALLMVVNVSMEARSCSVLISLDISAAFDTIHIDLLLQRLVSDFGIVGTASTWLRSYLIGRACYVAIGDCKSDVWTCDSGVPQGSVLWPLLFSAYVSPLSRILDQFEIKLHQYADDTQLYTKVQSTDPSQLQSLSDCVGALTYWFLSNGPQLNSGKSEAMIFGTRPGLEKLDRPQSFFIGGDSIAVKDKLKILGFHLDPLLSMDDHVKRTVRACNYHIRALRHVRKSLTLEVTRTIVHCLVTACLDYCNALLLGTTKSNIAKLQQVQCDLAQVVLQAPWRTSSKPFLEQLHWLPIQERVIF